MQDFFLTSWLVSGIHFTVWHMDAGIQGAQEGEGSLQGRRCPRLCSPGVGGQGSGRSVGASGSPQLCAQTSSFHTLPPAQRRGEALRCFLGRAASGYLLLEGCSAPAART